MKKDKQKIANFLFEIGTLRKIPRAHQQELLTQDLSDNIASHSFRVATIAWFLAKMENADPYKTTTMALFHDVGEVRSGDQNYIHKKYVKVYDDEIMKDQLGELPFNELFNLMKEYEERASIESIVAKDADLIDQILLLKEYAHQGNKEAKIWLTGNGDKNHNVQYRSLKTESAKKLANHIFKTGVSDWWQNIWTSKNK